MGHQEKPNSICMACGHPMYCGPYDHPLHKYGMCPAQKTDMTLIMEKLDAIERRLKAMEGSDGLV